jgi:hypothetical protein
VAGVADLVAEEAGKQRSRTYLAFHTAKYVLCVGCQTITLGLEALASAFHQQ